MLFVKMIFFSLSVAVNVFVKRMADTMDQEMAAEPEPLSTSKDGRKRGHLFTQTRPLLQLCNVCFEKTL